MSKEEQFAKRTGTNAEAPPERPGNPGFEDAALLARAQEHETLVDNPTMDGLDRLRPDETSKG